MRWVYYSSHFFLLGGCINFEIGVYLQNKLIKKFLKYSLLQDI